MFERIVAFWKGNDIVHLFGGFLRFGAQDKGPDQQHCQQPRGEPSEIQPHVLELGAPAWCGIKKVDSLFSRIS